MEIPLGSLVALGSGLNLISQAIPARWPLGRYALPRCLGRHPAQLTHEDYIWIWLRDLILDSKNPLGWSLQPDCLENLQSRYGRTEIAIDSKS
jgi:hypothetical protein